MAKSKKANFSNQLDRWGDLFNNAAAYYQISDIKRRQAILGLINILADKT